MSVVYLPIHHDRALLPPWSPWSGVCAGPGWATVTVAYNIWVGLLQEQIMFQLVPKGRLRF